MAPALALTGGPAQPEFQSFEPVNTTEMVNLPDGGFTYNIPLMDIGGYPLNLSYHSDITSDMEASCVGLGWSINPGVINRNVRALPDDFSGDKITKEYNLKANTTFGASVSASFELFGLDFVKLGLTMGAFYNNYWGIGYEFGVSPSISAGNKGSGSLTASLGTSLNSQSGANFNPSLSYSKKMEDKNEVVNSGFGSSLSTQINSRDGLKAINFSANYFNKQYIHQETTSSASFDYAGKTYTPEFAMPQTNLSVSLNFKAAGVELYGSDISPEVNGYFSTQFVRDPAVTKSAYGLLYSHVGSNNINALMDFNREKDGAFHDYTAHLPIVNPGYDVLSVNGQGIGGSFQLKRSDVPVFFDAKSVAEGGGGSLGFEFGSGNTAHGGVDLKFNYTNSTSKIWTAGNDILKKYNFQPAGVTGYEPAYYKAAGEMPIESDDQYYQSIGRDLAVYAPLVSGSNGPFDVRTSNGLINKYGGSVPQPTSTTPVRRVNRDRRNQVITYLTAAEASSVGLQKKILSFPLNIFNSFPKPLGYQPQSLVRVTPDRKGHHLSQIESVQPDGMRYVYGIPAYNLTQKEVSFSVSPTGLHCKTGKVRYTAIENSKGNKSGQDQYFNSVETPAYAHTYLLTAILGKDYEDISGNGPTEDDFGSYTEINYTRVADPTTGSTVYHWRVPFSKDSANYNPGLYSKAHDDKATYIYGQKEIWLVHSIESKTMIAEFTYADRQDGYGVIGENGGLAGNNLNRRLESITLYAKPDRLLKSDPTPIKTVYFQYSYDLCPDTENSVKSLTSIPPNPHQGKLTLTGLYFTFGFSKKGSLSDYKFSYKNQSEQFSSKDYDRWGNYKPSMVNPNCGNPAPGDPISNDEFPYSEQDSFFANQNAGTWSLNKIDLPSGGSINVDYDAKHYAYVQDRPAMRLMKIVGVGQPGQAYGNSLYYNVPGGIQNNLVVYFAIDQSVTTPAHLKRDYLKNVVLNGTYLYLKCYVKMNSVDKYEYVSLYSQIDDYGIRNGLGWVKLKPLPTTDKNSAVNLNPITKYGLQYMRENLPEIAYGQSAIVETDPPSLDLYAPLADMGLQLKQFVTGFNNEMTGRGYAKDIALDRSYIRLTEPSGFKYGGGSLVSRIIIEDHWGTMTGDVNNNFRYGQVYDYTMMETKSDGTKDTFSSGVASYEPMIGGDENPMRVADVISEDRKFAVDNIHYVEQPYGEVFMPSPQIVYSKISVRNLQYSNVTRTATGHSEMKYYTARDFPVKTIRTDIQKMPKRTEPILSLLKVKMKEHMNVSQGYLIETNNMHGQPKSNEVFDEKGERISAVFYRYKTKWPGELDNTVDVIQPDGSVTKGLLGVNYSLAGDAREAKTKTKSGGVAFNLDGFVIGPIPAIVPLPWPQFEQSEEQFRSMSFTKVVNKFGVLERTEAFDLGSMIATDNLAFDAETGEVLLTRTYNEFNDPIYNLKFPAHWAYEGMQGAYKNIGFQSSVSSTTTAGLYSVPATGGVIDYFMPGDEVLLNGTSKAWVLHKNLGSKNIFLIDIDGKASSIAGTNMPIKIIRSGRRNMPTTQIGSITSMENPIQGNVLKLNQSVHVLQAEATEYSDEWQTYCCELTEMQEYSGEMQLMNPFVNNVLGEWRPKKSWLYLTDRDRSALASTSSSTYIRDNGFYAQFTPFWHRPLGSTNQLNRYQTLWGKDETNWIWSATTTQINPNGTELESKNRLGLYSAEITGYYNQLITGVASNSRYRQIAFEGFEDFTYNSFFPDSIKCLPARHFGKELAYNISSEAYHTGKYSLKLASGSSASTGYKILENCTPQSSGLNIARPTMGPHITDSCSCIQTFSPDPGRYVVTAWVREGDGIGDKYYKNHKLSIFQGQSFVEFKASGAIVDGWQRIEGEFIVAPATTYIEIRLISIAPTQGVGGPVYFDDIRIFPFDGNMTNYVYDDISLKLLAELDANGYAKIYEYSQEGELIRIKQETERGIMTVQESRSSTLK